MNLGVSQQPLSQLSQTQVLWASNTSRGGIFVDKKTRRAPLKGDCLGLLNAHSVLPQPRTASFLWRNNARRVDFRGFWRFLDLCHIFGGNPRKQQTIPNQNKNEITRVSKVTMWAYVGTGGDGEQTARQVAEAEADLIIARVERDETQKQNQSKQEPKRRVSKVT